MGEPKYDDGLYAFQMFLEVRMPSIPNRGAEWLTAHVREVHGKEPWKTTQINGDETTAIPPVFYHCHGRIGGELDSYTVEVSWSQVHKLNQVHAFKTYVGKIAGGILRELPDGCSVLRRINVSTDMEIPVT